MNARDGLPDRLGRGATFTPAWRRGPDSPKARQGTFVGAVQAPSTTSATPEPVFVVATPESYGAPASWRRPSAAATFNDLLAERRRPETRLRLRRLRRGTVCSSYPSKLLPSVLEISRVRRPVAAAGAPAASPGRAGARLRPTRSRVGDRREPATPEGPERLGDRSRRRGWKVFVEQPESAAFAPLSGEDLEDGSSDRRLRRWPRSRSRILLARRLVRPIKRLQVAAEAIGAGAYDERIELDRKDELGALASAFNQMAERVQELITGLERRVAERTKAARGRRASTSPTSWPT